MFGISTALVKVSKTSVRYQFFFFLMREGSIPATFEKCPMLSPFRSQILETP